jgi:hypothetical protein
VIEPFNLFLLLVFAFIAAMFYMVYCLARASGETSNNRLATKAEVVRRAAAKGRSFEGSGRLSAWKLHGKLAGGEA